MKYRYVRRVFSRRRVSRRDELACRDAVRLMTDYLDGALPAHDANRLEAHLAGCAHCTHYLHQLQTTADVAGTAEPELDDATTQSLADLYRQWRAESS